MATHHHDRTIIARKVISIILEFFKQLQGESDTKVRMWQERTERRTPGGRRALLMAAVGSLASKRPGLEMTRSIDGHTRFPGKFGPPAARPAFSFGKQIGGTWPISAN